MIARIALALALLAAPAKAETWDCALTDLCDTGGTCGTPDDNPVAATLAVSDDGATGELTLGQATDLEKSVTLTGVHKTPDSRTFMAEIEDGTLGFFTLYDSGDLIASSHEKGVLGTSGVAVKGSCKRAAE